MYFGDIGEKCGILTNYFGAHPCPPQAHPAEWMLEVIDTTPGHSPIDWHDIWRNSDEYRLAHMELDTMENEMVAKNEDAGGNNAAGNEEFAMPFGTQLWYRFKRVWEQYWRTPCIYSKTALCVFTARRFECLVHKLLTRLDLGLFTGFSLYKD